MIFPEPHSFLKLVFCFFLLFHVFLPYLFLPLRDTTRYVHLRPRQSEPHLLGKAKRPRITMSEPILSTHAPHLPYVAHRRLVPYTHMQAPLPHNSVRASVIANELDRIQHRSRPHFSHVPTEDYLNSRAVVNFDDDVRSIRAHTATLLKRVQSPIPRATRMPLSSAFDHIETAIPERITSDAYISTLLSPRNNVDRVVQKMCQYPDIHNKAYHNIGKGHLACVTFSGGKAYPRRKYVMVSGHGADEARNVKADINFLSYYNKARTGANESATQEVPLHTNFRRSPESDIPRSFYRLVRPYGKATKSAPINAEYVETENNDPNGDVEEDIKPKRSKKSLSRQATLEQQQEDAAKHLAEEQLRREQEEEAERIAAELEREAAEQEELARLAKERRLAEERAEEEKLAAEREEEERLLALIAEQERIAAEKAEEEEILAREKAEQERLAAEKEEQEHLAAEEADRQRLEAEHIEEERLEAERIEAEREAEEERIRAALAEEERYAQDQGAVDQQKLAAELTENLLRIKAEKEKEERDEEEKEESSDVDRALTEEPEESKNNDEYVSDEDNDKAVAESSEEDEEAKDELVDEGHPIVEYPATPDVTGNESKTLSAAAEEVTSTEEEEEEE